MHSFLKGYETQHHAQYDHLGFTYELEAMIKVISLSLSLSLSLSANSGSDRNHFCRNLWSLYEYLIHCQSEDYLSY